MPPVGSEEFVFLARRLCYQSDLDMLATDVARHSHNVREINTRLLG